MQHWIGTSRRAAQLAVAMAVTAFGIVLGAQTPVGSADISRLETLADEVGSQIAIVRKTDVPRGAALAVTLGEVRDDITYLKVKFRRDGSLARTEYLDVRDRLESLRARAQGLAPPVPPPPSPGPAPGARVLAGSALDLRLATAISSRDTKADDRFSAATLLDYKIGDAVLVPAGSEAHGFVSSVRSARIAGGNGSVTLSFDEIVVAGRRMRLRATVDQVLDGQSSDALARLGLGADATAAIGMAAGRLTGTLVRGGTIASTEGGEVNLPVGTILRIRLDQALTGPAADRR